MASRSSICPDVITKKITINNWFIIRSPSLFLYSVKSLSEISRKLICHFSHKSVIPRFSQSWGVGLPQISLIRARPSNENFREHFNGFASVNHALLIWCYEISLLFSKIWRPPCRLFVHWKWLLIILQVYVGESEGWSAGERRENRKCMSYQKPISPPRSI